MGGKEIGSGFWTEDLPGRANDFDKRLPGDLVHMMCGRSAICYVIEDILRRDSIRVACLPAYTCTTTIEPFIKKGYKLRFYDIDENLNPVFNKALLEEASVLYIEGYFGFPNYYNGFLSECKRKGVTIIQDITHTVFSDDGISSKADYLVGSLRKWFGVPAGGFAVSQYGKFMKRPAKCDKNVLGKRTRALDAKRAYIQTGNMDMKQDMLKLFSDAEKHLAKVFDTQASDECSVRIVQHFPIQEMMDKRRGNYRYLRDKLEGILGIAPVFHEWGPGITPLFFPVFAERREKTIQQLIAQEIYTPVHWPVPDAIELNKYPNAKKIYSGILSIPCDQRYDNEDMKRIVEVLKCLK